MIFEKIELENLFSYYGTQSFDLRGGNRQRRIVLIHGRNGYGKTSSLNSLKLLFLGPSEELRRAVQSDRMPGPKQYVFGDGRDWSGIINRRARREGAKRAAIRLWLRDGEARYRLERSWEISGGSYEGELVIDLLPREDDDPRVGVTPVKGPEILQGGFSRSDGSLRGEEAEEFLTQLIPPFVVPFFIFDGEQVQTLAEANRSVQQEQIEKVLGIAPLRFQSQVLEQLIREWEREGLPEEVQVDLKRLEGRLGEIDAQIKEKESRIQRLEEEKERERQKLKELERQLDQLRGYDERVQSLRNEKDRERNRLDELLETWTEPFARIAPLLVNQTLLEELIQLLERQSKDTTTDLISVLQQLKEELQRKLLKDLPRPEPEFSPAQRAFVEKKLAQCFAHYLDPPLERDWPFRLPRERALALLKRLTEARGEGNRYQDQLREISRTKRRIVELQRQIDEAGSLSEEEKKRLAELKRKKADISKRLEALSEQIGALTKERDELKKRRRSTEKELQEKESEFRRLQEQQKRVKLARQLLDWTEAFRERLRKHKRKRLEEALNQRFQSLMTGHRLIAKIALAEDFSLTYLDSQGRTIGMGNLSAGMKQLVATALLWALEEISGVRLPVVIDTPSLASTTTIAPTSCVATTPTPPNR